MSLFLLLTKSRFSHDVAQIVSILIGELTLKLKTVLWQINSFSEGKAVFDKLECKFSACFTKNSQVYKIKMAL